MSDAAEPPKEHPSTYFVQDRTNQEEMIRLEFQDRMLTTGMGGVLPELSDPANLRRVLDVGCGTGGWLLEVARTYPTIKKLVGADISDKMLAYAHAQAVAEQLDKQVQFQATDALRALPFADNFFDLVNQRLGASWLRTWEWKKILLEYQRVVRTGGIIRITEYGSFENNSPALTKLNNITLETFYNSGRLFTASGDGVTGDLVRVMTQYGIRDVQTRVHTMLHRGGTQTGQYFYEDMRRAFRLLLPFFQRWTHVPSDYEEIYQQALKDMQQPDFVATTMLLTAWGTKPVDGRIVSMRGLR